MFNVVLVEPEIPANTGNIGRTCVLAGAKLHLVGPLGFELTDHALQRAGLAYWESLDVATYATWDEFVARHEGLRVAFGHPSGSAGHGGGVHLFTKRAARAYTASTYHKGDWLVFGKESSGLDAGLVEDHAELCERIPMLGDETLGNAGVWHERFRHQHPELRRDICGNFVDPRAGEIVSLNLSNAVAIVLYEALRQTGFPGMRV